MFIVAISFVLGFGLLSLGGIVDVIRQMTSRDYTGPRRPDELGKVGDKSIKQSEYDNMKNYYKWLYMENTRARNIPEQLEEQFAAQAWNYLVAEKALEETYKKERIDLMFEEVIEILKLAPPREIVNDTQFYTDGKFDAAKYEQVLYTQRFIQTHFPAYRDFIRSSRLDADARNAFRVTNAQLADDQAKDNTRFSITYLALEPNAFVKPPNDTQIWAYYRSHRKEFDKPERRTMRYAVFPLRVGPEDSASAKAQIDETYASLKTDEDFLYSTDRENDSLGFWFKTDSLDSIVRVTLATLEPGKHTEPLLTREGWQIVKLDEHAKDSVRIRTITVPIEVTSATYSTIRDNIDNLVERAKDENFDSIAKDLNVDVREAPPLEKGKPYEFAPEIAGSVENFARTAKVGDISPVLRTNQNELYVFRLNAIQRGLATVMDTFEVRNKVSSKIVSNQAWPKMQTRAQQLLRDLKTGKPMEDLSKNDSQVRLNTRQQVSVAAFGYIGPEFAGTVLGLQPGKTSGLVKTERGLYIIRCDDRQEGGVPPNPYQAQTKQTNILQKVRDALNKTPKIVDWRNPFNL